MIWIAFTACLFVLLVVLDHVWGVQIARAAAAHAAKRETEARAHEDQEALRRIAYQAELDARVKAAREADVARRRSEADERERLAAEETARRRPFLQGAYRQISLHGEGNRHARRAAKATRK